MKQNDTGMALFLKPTVQHAIRSNHPQAKQLYREYKKEGGVLSYQRLSNTAYPIETESPARKKKGSNNYSYGRRLQNSVSDYREATEKAMRKGDFRSAWASYDLYVKSGGKLSWNHISKKVKRQK